MSIQILNPLPNAEEIVAKYPLTAEHKIAEHRRDVQNVLAGTDPRFIIITGPCSAYPSDTVREFSERLVEVAEQVREKLILVIRVYIQKPRTTVGWTGPLYEPDPNSAPNVLRGIDECRKMMVNVARLHPIADEMLFTHNAGYFTDILSYVAVGARSGEDPEHRFTGSGLDIPVGVKNPTSGDIELGINGVQAVQARHIYSYQGNFVQSSGNPYGHLILRGGKDRSNYDPRSIVTANALFETAKVQNPAIIVDASHENSSNGKGKDPRLQTMVVDSVLRGKTEGIEGYNLVKGVMLEANIKAGKQPIGPNMDPHVSITDACIDFETNRRIIFEAAERL